MKDFPFPKSFPDANETLFLKLVLSDNKEFQTLWNEWRATIVFDDINYAMTRLLPLLYLRTRALGIEDDITGKLKGTYKLIWLKNQLLIDSGAKAIGLLQEHNIPVMILKGAPLLLNTYKDLGARYLGDVDILIHPSHAQKAVMLLLAHGWSDIKGWRHPNPTFGSHEKETARELTLVGKGTAFSNQKDHEIDLHWKLFYDHFHLFKKNNEHPMSYAALLKNAEPLMIKNLSCTTPCPEDALIHIIVHGAVHNAHRTIRWVTDTSSIIKTSNINWTRLIEHTTTFGFEIEVTVAFSYLVKNFNLPIPKSFQDELSKLTFSKKDLDTYYKTGKRAPYRPFGIFPLLWHMYWNYESKGSFPMNLYYFLDYLCKNWGLQRKRDLVAFIVKKYKSRLL